MGFEQWIDELKEEKSRLKYLIELQKYLARAMMKEPFELIKDYVTQTQQLDRFKNQSWYQFARMIRNNISHSMRFEFRQHDLEKLPVTWNGKTIEASMDGQVLSLQFIYPDDIIYLIDIMLEFVDKDLN